MKKQKRPAFPPAWESRRGVNNKLLEREFTSELNGAAAAGAVNAGASADGSCDVPKARAGPGGRFGFTFPQPPVRTQVTIMMGSN
ncbi:MAG: hypothetical protein ABSH49_08255 [Bryobacteraceae bacterium]